MIEISEQEKQEAITNMALENCILRKKLKETLENESRYLTMYLEASENVERLQKELEEIKQEPANPAVAV